MASQVTNVSNWYTNAYGGPFRSSRLRAPSLLPGAQRPVIQVQQTLVVDAARHNNNSEGKDGEKVIRRRETIFGPDVGEDDEPGWTKAEEGAKVSVDVVKGWVERAKNEEGLHATTTLQALVNLKRPTLQLQQLDPVESEIVPASETDSRRGSYTAPPLHILKYNYDATAPAVHITISIYPNPQAPKESLMKDGDSHSQDHDVDQGEDADQDQEEETPPKVIYHGTHPGGFNREFTLPATSAFDLSSTIAPMPVSGEEVPGGGGGQDDKKDLVGYDTSAVRESEDTTRSSLDRSTALHHRNSTQAGLATVPELDGTAGNNAVNANGAAEEANNGRRPRRFGNLFGRRNREPDVEEGVTNIEMTETQEIEEKEKQAAQAEKEMERGMRLLIKIDALGEDGSPLKRRNAQLTHILINGMWVADSAANAAAAPNQPPVGKRVWVVKVVRREAVIGAHTFLLKEIYGLSSSSSTQTQATTTYPPTAGAAAEDPYASTPNECIVCLTSPRDVVLLPCRHLVVCRECAVGMVEFGAGGKVARREDTTGDATAAGTDGAAAGTTTGGAAAATTPAAPQVAGGTTVTGRERRKKKAKGWYCPVCRQPYTSLLRLTLPTSAKPGHSHEPSRAPSVRSVHTTRSRIPGGDGASLRRVPSHAPTLPDGAERMLEGLRPAHLHDDAESEDDENVDVNTAVPLSERPQFVLGQEVELDENTNKAKADFDAHKQEVEHREVMEAKAHGAKGAAQDEVSKMEQGMSEVDLGEPVAQGRASVDSKKGWKEVA